MGSLAHDALDGARLALHVPAGRETDATALSRHLYDRLRRECPQSPEAKERAVYYDLAPPAKAADSGSDDSGDADDKEPTLPDLSAASDGDSLPDGQLEYRWTAPGDDGSPPDEDPAFDKIEKRAIALGTALLQRSEPAAPRGRHAPRATPEREADLD